MPAAYGVSRTRFVGMAKPRIVYARGVEILEGVDRAEPAVEKPRQRRRQRLGGRVAHAVAERPHRAPETILRADIVEPRRAGSS